MIHWNVFKKVVVQLPSLVWLFASPWTAAHQASLSLTISCSLPKFMLIVLEMLSSHLTLWHPHFLLPLILPSIRDFSNEFSVQIQWPKYWMTKILASVLTVSIQGWCLLRLTVFISLLSKGVSEVFSSITVQRHQYFGVLPSLWSNSHNQTWPLGRPAFKNNCSQFFTFLNWMWFFNFAIFQILWTKHSIVVYYKHFMETFTFS